MSSLDFERGYTDKELWLVNFICKNYKEMVGELFEKIRKNYKGEKGKLWISQTLREDFVKFLKANKKVEWALELIEDNKHFMAHFLTRMYVSTLIGYKNFKKYSAEEAAFFAVKSYEKNRIIFDKNLQIIEEVSKSDPERYGTEVRKADLFKRKDGSIRLININEQDLILPAAYLKQLGFQEKTKNIELYTLLVKTIKTQESFYGLSSDFPLTKEGWEKIRNKIWDY